MEINKVELWQSANFLENKMRDLGVAEIRYSTDHLSLEKQIAKLEKQALGEHFKRALHVLPPNKFMWISAYDEEGAVIAVVAGRLDDIGSWSLQQFIHAHFSRVIDAEDGGHVRVKAGSAEFAKDISGPCAYVGEGYAVKEWRRKGLASLMVKYLMLIAWDEWRPSVIYGWMRRRHVETGMAVNWGFTEMYETPFEFESPPVNKDWNATFFVGVGAKGIFQMIRSLQIQSRAEASHSMPKKQLRS